ncbi:MAG: hypothetical protein ACI4EJ_06555, partial [Bacteroides sp.]
FLSGFGGVQMLVFFILYPALAVFLLPLRLRRGTDACFLYPVPRLRSILLHQNTVAPKSSCFMPDVLRTFDFAGIAPGKGNACFACASFSLERDKSRFSLN